MFSLVVHLRVNGVIGTVVDSYGQRTASAPAIARGLTARMCLRPLHPDGTPFSLAELDYAAWDFVLAHDWITSTPPQIRIQEGITTAEVEEGGVTYAEVRIPLAHTNTEELIAILGNASGCSLGAELAGMPEGDSTPGLLIQFNLDVRNRRGTAATGTPVPVGDGNYSASQVDSLLAAKADHSVVAPAAETIHGHRAVLALADGVHHASSDEVGHAPGVLGIAANSASPGDPVRVRTTGPMTEPSWAWTPGLPLYVGPDGVLVQSPPASGFIREIGLAVSPTSIVIRHMVPITLAT
jgi:hypothetical protein